ncbi:hypothetical protein COB11_08075 [Candidatus Aerophobetes bacterium]|uniref:H repeat-associated protein N-terminal domain-containing protein n=1 Tax=Aerophobetes bacterium TaxID=2030807 RepID=A0A2A4YB14_UNCAE|nr:MAG: hypothetical protein COB11_08075 [Candidatus Aerophobetes bacterium]
MLLEYFSVIEDPRLDRSKRYPLVHILILSFVFILAGQNIWHQIQAFCEETLDWFSEFLNTSLGVSSLIFFCMFFLC